MKGSSSREFLGGELRDLNEIGFRPTASSKRIFGDALFLGVNAERVGPVPVINRGFVGELSLSRRSVSVHVLNRNFRASLRSTKLFKFRRRNHDVT